MPLLKTALTRPEEVQRFKPGNVLPVLSQEAFLLFASEDMLTNTKFLSSDMKKTVLILKTRKL